MEAGLQSGDGITTVRHEVRRAAFVGCHKPDRMRRNSGRQSDSTAVYGSVLMSCWGRIAAATGKNSKPI